MFFRLYIFIVQYNEIYWTIFLNSPLYTKILDKIKMLLSSIHLEDEVTHTPQLKNFLFFELSTDLNAKNLIFLSLMYLIKCA